MPYKHSMQVLRVLRLSSGVTPRLLADVVGQILVWPTLIGGLKNFVRPCVIQTRLIRSSMRLILASGFRQFCIGELSFNWYTEG